MLSVPNKNTLPAKLSIQHGRIAERPKYYDKTGQSIFAGSECSIGSITSLSDRAD